MRKRMLKKTLEWGRRDENAKKERKLSELSEMVIWEKMQNESGADALRGWELDCEWEKRTTLGQWVLETLGKGPKETLDEGVEENLGNSLGKDTKDASEAATEEKKKTNRKKKVTWEWGLGRRRW